MKIINTILETLPITFRIVLRSAPSHQQQKTAPFSECCVFSLNAN